MAYPTHGHEYHERQSWKAPCRAATTADITIATALNAADVLDGVTLAAGDRVLVKDQTAPEENGIYVVAATPSRAVDFASEAEIVGAVVMVIEGTANEGTAWRCETPAPIVVGTDAIDFAAFGGGGAHDTSHEDGGADEIDLTGLSGTPAALTTHAGAADPHTGYVREADASWVDLTDAGVTTLHSHVGGAGDVATDAIWDAAGDLAVGTGADTAARLAIGAAGLLLKSNGTSAAWALPTFRGCVAVRSTDQTGVVTGTDTVIAWNGTDDYDSDSYHDPSSNASRITCPAGLAGWYEVKAGVVWDTNATNYRHIWLRKNGSTAFSNIVRNASFASYLSQHVSGIVYLDATDYVEAIVFQDSGTNRTLSFGTLFNGRFSAHLLGAQA